MLALIGAAVIPAAISVIPAITPHAVALVAVASHKALSVPSAAVPCALLPLYFRVPTLHSWAELLQPAQENIPWFSLRRCSAFVRGLGGVLAEALLHLAVVCAVVLRSGKDV